MIKVFSLLLVVALTGAWDDQTTTMVPTIPTTPWPTTTESTTTDPPMTTTCTEPTSTEGTTIAPPDCDRTPRSCHAPGPLCRDCNALVTCVENADHTFDMLLSEYCPLDNGKRCVKGRCTHQADPVCDGLDCLEFPCTDTGIFPDQFDCTKYHVCITSDRTGYLEYHEKKTCPEGFSYDPKTTYCDKPLNTPECQDYPVPPCGDKPLTAALPTNPSIYYSCTIYGKIRYPVLYLCPHGTVFQDYQCR